MVAVYFQLHNVESLLLLFTFTFSPTLKRKMSDMISLKMGPLMIITKLSYQIKPFYTMNSLFRKYNVLK